MRQRAFEFALANEPTLELFVPARNAELLQRLRALAEPGGERCIYIWGAVGSGRTHLLKGTLSLLREAGWRTAYVAGEPHAALPPNLHELDAVAVDDVERLSGTAQVELFNLYNALREKRGTLIVSGNAAPMQLALRPDVVTRLGWGLVYQVHALTDGEKEQALSQHAAARGFALEPDVRQYLLTRVQRDMPTLLSMLDALDRYSLEAKRPITVPLLRELLTDVKQ